MAGLKRYDVVDRNGYETTLLLSDADAEARGLTVKSAEKPANKAVEKPANKDGKPAAKKAPAKKAPAKKAQPKPKPAE